MTFQALVLISPAVLIMLGTWFSEYRFSRRFDWAGPGCLEMLEHLARSLRSNVGWLLIPMMIVMFVVDLSTHAPLPEVIPGWSVWLMIAVGAILLLPVIVRRIFPTTPMDQDTHHWIETIVAATGTRPLKIAQWDTKFQIHNAMVAGLLGRFRVLVLSDRLVAELPRPEQAMVILHELAHVQRHHVPLRVLSLIPAWLLGAVVERIVAGTHESGAWAAWAPAIGAIVSLLATVLVLRLVSYRSEFDADKVACEIAEKIAGSCLYVPTSRSEAATELSTALLKVTGGSEAARKPTWLHPGINDRITRLRQFGRSVPNSMAVVAGSETSL